MKRGKLHVYLGAAPGVGKTYDMLGEGHRRRNRGQDVVIGIVETYDRPLTAAMTEGLETVPRKRIDYRGGAFTEMDVDAILARQPAVALIDELAHTNVPGARNEKRWQDVEELLAAGIRVITTVNIQHLESLNDIVESITRIRQRETIPDEVVRRADQIELVDMSPEGLRRRLAHGNVYPPEKIDAALGNYFRTGNLTALRELALLWVADRVEEGLEKYRAEHDIDQPWAARERVVVAITGGPEGATVIRRAARIAARAAGGELLAVHVTRSDGLESSSAHRLAELRTLVESLGGSFHQVVGDNVPMALLDFARGVNATQLVLGSSRRQGWRQFLDRGVAARVTPDSGDIDVHIVTHEEVGKQRLPTRKRSISRQRYIASWLVAMLGQPLLALGLVGTRESHGLESEMLLFLTLSVGVALLGGIVPALVGAVFGALLLNFFFTTPLYTFIMNQPEQILAVVVFPMVAGAVAVVVDLAARRTSDAVRARAEAETLATLAGSVLRGERALPALLERVRETFGMNSAALLERDDGANEWRVLGQAGANPVCERPTDADEDVLVRDGLVLAMRGSSLPAGDRRILEAFAAHIGAAVERDQLAKEAKESRRLAEANRIRTALLAAVSHDLRTPIAAVKAQAATLRQTDVELAESDRNELLEGIEISADRLAKLVANLLDMSRVQTGSVTPQLQDVSLAELVPVALRGIPDEAVKVNLPTELPMIRTDPGLLERVIANITENAVRHNPPGEPVIISASSLSGQVETRVIDRGPGVLDEQKDTIFEPFQRIGDAPNGNGVGLGLAVARGFTEILGGSLEPEDTPRGGLTMVLTLPTRPTAIRATTTTASTTTHSATTHSASAEGEPA